MIDYTHRNYELLRRLNGLGVNWEKIKSLERDRTYYSEHKHLRPNKTRRYVCMLELYPEQDQDMLFLRNMLLSNSMPYECVLHDRDRFEEDAEPDENGNGGHKKGDLKKAHLHMCVRFPNARTKTAVAKDFNLNCQFIEMWDSLSEALMYLTHRAYVDKVQYDLTDCYGTLGGELSEAHNIVRDKYENIDRIKRFIDDCPNTLTSSAVYARCRKYHCADIYIRNRPLINDFIRDHNNYVYAEKQESVRNADLKALVLELRNDNADLRKELAQVTTQLAEAIFRNEGNEKND